MTSDTIAKTCANVDGINRRELRQQEDSSNGFFNSVTNRELRTASASCPSSLNLDSDVFSSVDIGSVSTPGETSYSDYGVWNIKGNGYICGGCARDKIHYTYYHHPSNGSIDARIFVRSFTTGTEGTPRAGLMIRKRLTETSEHYSLVVTRNKDTGINQLDEIRKWRTRKANSIDSTPLSSIGDGGVWLRIAKAADIPQFHSYYSLESNPTEADWVTISTTKTFYSYYGGPTEISSVGDFHVGVAVGSREGDVLKGESW